MANGDARSIRSDGDGRAIALHAWYWYVTCLEAPCACPPPRARAVARTRRESREARRDARRPGCVRCSTWGSVGVTARPQAQRRLGGSIERLGSGEGAAGLPLLRARKRDSSVCAGSLLGSWPPPARAQSPLDELDGLVVPNRASGPGDGALVVRAAAKEVSLGILGHRTDEAIGELVVVAQ